METKSLEVVLDKSLTWDLRIKLITKKIVIGHETTVSVDQLEMEIGDYQ